MSFRRVAKSISQQHCDHHVEEEHRDCPTFPFSSGSAHASPVLHHSIFSCPFFFYQHTMSHRLISTSIMAQTIKYIWKVLQEAFHGQKLKLGPKTAINIFINKCICTLLSLQVSTSGNNIRLQNNKIFNCKTS